MVIASSTELFHSYRITLAQCAKLSTGSRLLELTKTFSKYLDIYAQQVLHYHLTERAGPSGPSTEDTIVILNTADYCYSTTTQLEERIKSRIDPEYKDQIDLQSQADAFIGICSASLRTLVRSVESSAEPAWRSMRSEPWSRMDSVGDQSAYVSTLLQIVRDRSAAILRLLHKPQYSRGFCDHLVDSLTSTYLSVLVACRPVTEQAAEQMLLDAYVLKAGLASLPVLTSEPATAPPAPFVKRLSTTFGRLDPLLKTLQVRAHPAEGLVQAYLIHLRDKSEPNFRKVLELKGVRNRVDATHLVELFNAHKASSANDSLPLSNPLLANLQLSAGAGPGVGSAGTALSGRLPDAGANSPVLGIAGGGRFDALGSALMNAAKEGVDRFGSPALGGGGFQSGSHGGSGAGASRAVSPPGGGGGGAAVGMEGQNQGQGALEGNLRNIGRFFRRRGEEGRQSLDRR